MTLPLVCVYVEASLDDKDLSHSKAHANLIFIWLPLCSRAYFQIRPHSEGLRVRSLVYLLLEVKIWLITHAVKKCAIFNNLVFSHEKNDIFSFVTTWMNLDNLMLGVYACACLPACVAWVCSCLRRPEKELQMGTSYLMNLSTLEEQPLRLTTEPSYQLWYY